MTPKPPTLEALKADPSIHHWVKVCADLAATKDPVDAALGFELLARVFKSRTDSEICLCGAGSKDGVCSVPGCVCSEGGN